MGPILVTHCRLFFFQYANSPNLVKKKEEKKPSTDRSERKKKKKKKKKNRTTNQEKKGKKKVKSGQKLQPVLFVGPLSVFNYNIVIELWVMEIENSQNVFSVSITHNSKIRELGDGNRVIVCHRSHHFWVINYENWKLSYENRLSKQPLIFHCVDLMTSESTQDICRCSYNKYINKDI